MKTKKKYYGITKIAQGTNPDGVKFITVVIYQYYKYGRSEPVAVFSDPYCDAVVNGITWRSGIRTLDTFLRNKRSDVLNELARCGLTHISVEGGNVELTDKKTILKETQA